MQTQRIVVAIDFSEPSVQALRWVARSFARDAELVLAHVIDIPEPPALIRELSAPADVLEVTAREGAERKLGEIGRDAGVKRTLVDIRRGAVADCVVDAADDYRAEMIVVGAHREREGLWNKLGSTAERIIGRSHVPVLLAANPGTRPPAHVLAATDGSDISTMVDQWGERLSRQLSVPWTRLSVVSTSVPTAPLGEALATNDGESAGRGQWITREIADETSNAPVIAFGEPGAEILAAAARYPSGIIVVGRRGAGWVRRALFGSVTKEVLHGARCPVLVVVEPGRDRRDDEP